MISLVFWAIWPRGPQAGRGYNHMNSFWKKINQNLQQFDLVALPSWLLLSHIDLTRVSVSSQQSWEPRQHAATVECQAPITYTDLWFFCLCREHLDTDQNPLPGEQETHPFHDE